MIPLASSVQPLNSTKWHFVTSVSYTHLLGDPTLLQLLFDPADMVVAIVCRDTEVSGGQEVRINPRGLKSRNCFEFCSSMFLRKLREVHGGLDANASYRLTGKIIPELRAARFPMSTIQKLSLIHI